MPSKKLIKIGLELIFNNLERPQTPAPNIVLRQNQIFDKENQAANL
jgi:hypothetical protein